MDLICFLSLLFSLNLLEKNSSSLILMKKSTPLDVNSFVMFFYSSGPNSSDTWESAPVSITLIFMLGKFYLMEFINSKHSTLYPKTSNFSILYLFKNLFSFMF